MVKILLIVVQGKPEGKTIPVVGPVFRIGRGLDCHLRPNSEEVSRNHTEIVLTPTEAVVRDLGSRNGTRVNGKLLTGPHTLKSGELLQIGPLTFAIAIQGVTADSDDGKLAPAGVAAGTRPGSTSLDDVPADQIDAWLVADNTKPTPDRPSGVYDGDTLTLESYKEVVQRARQGGSSGTIPVNTAGAAPSAKASEPTTPAPRPAPAPPEPAPVAKAPEPAPAAPTPAPAAPKVEAKAPASEPQMPDITSQYDAILDSIERLPEGAGDDAGPTSMDDDDRREDDEDREDADGDDDEKDADEEFIDESNPFYAAKKAAAQGGKPDAPTKPSYQDSSQAASDILKKMLEQRRAPRRVLAGSEAPRGDSRIIMVEPSRSMNDNNEPGPQLRRLLARLEASVLGQRPLLVRLLVALLADGHVLIEGVPGLAKTRAVRTLAAVLGLPFRRIQFTPDLLPADLTGTEIYQPATGTFATRAGPIVASVLLADEINRAPAKVQSALLEAMQERQVTIGATTIRLPDPFFVLATQNPIEHEGTYPLPEAQLDRFLMKILVGYPDRSAELALLDLPSDPVEIDEPEVSRRPGIVALRAAAAAVHAAPVLRAYLVDLVRATRDPIAAGLPDLAGAIELGASPRASLALLSCARAHALIEGREYATPHDVKSIAADVLRHRLLLTYDAEAREISPEAVIRRILDHVPVPLA